MSPDRVPPAPVLPLTGPSDRRGDRSIPQVPAPETTPHGETLVMVPAPVLIALLLLPLAPFLGGGGLLAPVAALIASAASRGSALRYHRVRVG